ncbi:hypothetical protein FH608_019295 [Nonomuraea phyllanthi]|uniref:Uncharacterized protein n=1 Tax=Nonomuraea phyllanthi TaxID=2219224 RepID=A0A5C4WI31_9ACTN|nr:hypothetical protein FH608_019295 [Nonomuraea phyllanthi]
MNASLLSTGQQTGARCDADVEARSLDAAREDLLAFAAFPRETWRQIWSNCEDRLVPPGQGPGPWSNWPCCLWVDLPVLAPVGACWRRTGRRVSIGALPLQGTVTVLTVTPARRRPSPHRSFEEPDDHRQHARARLRPPGGGHQCLRRGHRNSIRWPRGSALTLTQGQGGC